MATDAAAAAANALSVAQTKADAQTVSALTNEVSRQGADISANGSAIVDINTSIAQVGGENLLYNPSFDTPSAANPNLAEGWGWRKSNAVVVTPTLRNSDLGAEGKCQRLDVTGLVAGTGDQYVDFVAATGSPDRRPPVYEGVVGTASIFARGNTGLMLQIFMQYKDASGATLATHGPVNVGLTPTYSRIVLTGLAAPANSVRVDILFRIRSAPGSSLTGGFVDLDKAQYEHSPVVTGWRDNGKTNAAAADVNASATSALAGRVGTVENGVNSTSSQLTQLENSIGDVGGENLFYNPTFSRPAAVSSQVVDGWEMEGAASSVESVVTSWLNSGEKAIRTVLSGVTSGSPYKSVRTPGPRRIKVASGQSVTASCYARRSGDNPLFLRIWIQWTNDAGTVLSAVSSSNLSMSVAGDRFTYTAVAPANATQAIVYFRIHGTTSTAVSGTVELARPQAEYGTRATGWRDNGQLNAADNSATSAAVESLTSAVNQQGGTLSSVAGRTTSLENSLTTTNQNVTTAQQAAQAAATAAGSKGEVIYGATAPAADKRLAQNLWIDTTGNANTPKRWNGSTWVAVSDKVAADAAAAAASALSQVATKAEAAALQTLANRVTAAEGVNTSQSNSLIDLSNSVGAIQSGLGASGLDPAPGGYWQFDTGTEGWVAGNASVSASGGALRLTPTTSDPQLLSSTGTLTLTIPGAQYTKVRVGLTRRGGSASAWTGTLYYSTPSHGISSSYRASAPNPNIAVGQSAVVEWDMTNLASGGTDWVDNTIRQLRFNFANALDAVWDIDWIAVGRVGPSASSRALESLSSTVTQQGEKITAEAIRTDGLYTAVGDANAAIQNEAKARVDGEAALSKQLQTTQASLGTTNAAVQQVATAQADMKGMLNAQYTMRVQVNNQYGAHVWAGFGIGINSQNGIVQSAFVINADKFVLLNSSSGLSSPFSIVGGQTFVDDAYIRAASITNAKIADAAISNAKIANGAITAAKIGVAEIDTLRIRGNAVTVPVSANSPGNVLGIGVGQWQNLIAIGVQMDEGGFITAQYSCYQGFGSGIRKYQFQMDINGLVIAQGGGDWADGFPNLMGSIGVAPGYFVITVKWWGENSGVGVQNHTLYAMGTKR